MGTCGCHWARGRREAPAAKVAAGGRMPLARHTLRAGGCRWQDTRCGRADAVGKTHAAGGRMPRGRTRIRSAALFAHRSTACHGLRHRPQSPTPHDRARLRPCAIMGGGAVGRNAKCTCDTRLLLPSVRKALRTLNRGKICTSCMIRGVCAAKRAPSWQDLRAVYPPTAICGAFRMHGAHILPKPARFRMHGARILPRTGDFPARGHFRDAWSAKLATD